MASTQFKRERDAHTLALEIPNLDVAEDLWLASLEQNSRERVSADDAAVAPQMHLQIQSKCTSLSSIMQDPRSAFALIANKGRLVGSAERVVAFASSCCLAHGKSVGASEGVKRGRTFFSRSARYVNCRRALPQSL